MLCAAGASQRSAKLHCQQGRLWTPAWEKESINHSLNCYGFLFPAIGGKFPFLCSLLSPAIYFSTALKHNFSTCRYCSVPVNILRGRRGRESTLIPANQQLESQRPKPCCRRCTETPWVHRQREKRWMTGQGTLNPNEHSNPLESKVSSSGVGLLYHRSL